MRMTSMKVKGAALVIALVALSGCATDGGSGAKSAEWEGKNVAALLAKWGATQEKTAQNDGSELWVYHRTKESTVGGAAPATTTRVERTEAYIGMTTHQVAYQETSYDSTKVMTSSCEARFVVKDGVVKSAVFKGDCN